MRESIVANHVNIIYDSHDIAHGIAAAYYDTENDPTLECLCSEQFSGDTWQTAGELLDCHLEESSSITSLLVTTDDDGSESHE